MNTQINGITLDISVITIHGNSAEFIIDAAAERNNKDICFYYEQLSNMVESTIVDKSWRLLGYQVYYTISLQLEITNISDISLALDIVNTCVEKWKNTYKIDKFKK